MIWIVLGSIVLAVVAIAGLAIRREVIRRRRERVRRLAKKDMRQLWAEFEARRRRAGPTDGGRR